jgi:glycosyltransferase involved in cell wall biosynthesis
MQFKKERWCGSNRQELVTDVKPGEQQAVSQDQLIEAPQSLGEEQQKLIGEMGVEVIVVADSARAVVGCLQAYHRAKVWEIKYHLTVVDSGGSDFLTGILITLAAKHGFRLLFADEPGQLPGLCKALSQSTTDWFVVLSQHVRVHDSWLNDMARLVDEHTAAVTASSNMIVPIASGMCAAAMAESFHNSVVDRGAVIPFPRENCLLVSRRVLNECGGLDLDYYRPGGGHFLDFYLEACKRGYQIKLAERCWVHDTCVDYRGNITWEPQSRHGFYRFLSRHGEKALAMQREQYVKIDFPDSIAAQFKPLPGGRKDVVFVFREAVVCGLVLAVTEICNGLNRTGRWNAYFICTKFDEPERRRIPMNFAPVVVDSEVMLHRWLAERKHAIVVGTLWNTAKDIQDSAVDSSCKRVYFIQDDERRFRHVSGALYVEPVVVLDQWRAFTNRVVNSNWVKLELAKQGLQSKRIGIGVDTMRFIPREKCGSRVRVMAHSRPSTPRRGWPFIRDVMNRAAKSVEFDLVTYDEPPVGLEVPSHSHIGKVSPDELAEHMGKADIFFEGSEFQGWGMQSLEAMSSGCALVSTDNEGIHEFATAGYDCVVVQHGDVIPAAAVLCHLMVNATERQILQDRARNSSTTFSWDAICHAWDVYLRGLV